MSACERRLASSPKRSAPSNHRRQEPRPSFKGSGSAPFADTENHAPKSSSPASATGATLDIETQHASTTSTRLQKYVNGVRRQTPTVAARYPKTSTATAPRLYIAPTILTAGEVSSSPSTGLRRRISAIVSSTFLRATASTNA